MGTGTNDLTGLPIGWQIRCASDQFKIEYLGKKRSDPYESSFASMIIHPSNDDPIMEYPSQFLHHPWLTIRCALVDGSVILCHILLAFASVNAQHNELADQTHPIEVQEWVAKNAIELKTVAPLSELDDLEPLREIVGDARIVGLGESTHGTREFFQLRHRILEYLVREMNFNIFAIEATMPEAMDINQYVLHGKGDPQRALAGLYFWTSDTWEMLDIIEWMRDYNTSQSEERKVKFYGFDMQSPTRAAKEVLTYLQSADPSAARRVEAILEPLLDPFTGRHIRSNWTDQQRQALSDSLLEISGLFDTSLQLYSSSVGSEETQVARQHLEILLMFLGVNGISRDEAMAENVRWILDHEGPGSKAVLWDHNRHVAVESGWQGHYLRESVGQNYCAIGFIFDQGGFQARNLLADGVLEPFYLGSAPDSTFESVIGKSLPDIALLDLASLPETGPVKKWFYSSQSTRSIGSGYTSEHPEWYIWNIIPAETFNAIAFVRKTTPARATLTGQYPGVPAPVTYPVNLDFESGLKGKWPPGWIPPRGAAILEWDVQLTDHDVHSGKQSLLIHRGPPPYYGETHASISQRVDAGHWRGKSLTLGIWARIENKSKAKGHLWINVTAPGPYYSDTVVYESIPIESSSWKQYHITIDVPLNADVIDFGFAFSGDGDAHIDAISLD